MGDTIVAVVAPVAAADRIVLVAAPGLGGGADTPCRYVHAGRPGNAIVAVGLAVLAARNSRRYAFALGPLAVFVLLVSNRYY